MLISSKARYAVMAMLDLASAQEDHPISLAAISVRQNLPLPYLEQLFSKLRQANLVTSSRGATGGYVLARPADQICVEDILRAVDKPMQATRCDVKTTTGCQAKGQRCLPHDLWEELESVIHLFLSKVTLDDVCNRRVLGMGRLLFSFPHSQSYAQEISSCA